MEAINTLDSMKHNSYSQSDKVAWLSRLDALVKLLIIDTHEGDGDVTFTGYDEATSPETPLLVPAPFDEIYLRWMEAQIDYANGEYTRYNNAITLYNTVFEAYRNHYHRLHMPKGKRLRYF